MERIMKQLQFITATLICLVFFGCGKTTKLEGKVVDGKGGPLSGVRISVTQAEPIKGYEKFEATTGADGAFSFKDLYPNARYSVVSNVEGIVSMQDVITTAAKGETKLLPNPIIITFVPSKDGLTMHDTRTGLTWMRDPSQISPMNWQSATNYLPSIAIGGRTNWRLPTAEEARSLTEYSDGRDLSGIGFKNIRIRTYYWCSTSTPNSGFAPESAYCINGGIGNGLGMATSMKSLDNSVWPVTNDK